MIMEIQTYGDVSPLALHSRLSAKVSGHSKVDMMKISSTSIIWMGSKQLFVSGHRHKRFIVLSMSIV